MHPGARRSAALVPAPHKRLKGPGCEIYGLAQCDHQCVNFDTTSIYLIWLLMLSSNGLSLFNLFRLYSKCTSFENRFFLFFIFLSCTCRRLLTPTTTSGSHLAATNTLRPGLSTRSCSPPVTYDTSASTQRSVNQSRSSKCRLETSALRG